MKYEPKAWADIAKSVARGPRVALLTVHGAGTQNCRLSKGKRLIARWDDREMLLGLKLSLSVVMQYNALLLSKAANLAKNKRGWEESAAKRKKRQPRRIT